LTESVYATSSLRSFSRIEFEIVSSAMFGVRVSCGDDWLCKVV
jgi:hypothetical protein